MLNYPTIIIRVPLAVASILFAAGVWHGSAIAGTAYTGVTFPMDAARTITVSASSIDFGTISTSEVLAGQTNEQVLTATIRANRNWKVQIKGMYSYWTEGLGGRANKPVEDIQYRVGTGGSFTSLTTTNTTIGSSSTPTGSSGTQLSTYFKVYLKNNETGILDAPAQYDYNYIVLTLSEY